MKEHGYSLEDLENMILFERDLYVMLLNNYIEEHNRKIQAQAGITRVTA